MENPKWWNVAVAAITVVLSVMLLLVGDLSLPRMLAAQAALALFAVGWYTIGRLSWRRPGAAMGWQGRR